MVRNVLAAAAFACAVLAIEAIQAEEPASSYEPFFEMQVRYCSVSAFADPKWRLLRVDLHRKTLRQDCALSEAETIALFAAVFEAHAATGDAATYASLMIGAVANYAWMQRYLTDTARGDPDWSPESGRPVVGHANSYLKRILSVPRVMQPFNRAGAPSGYRLSEMSCEKVFISDDGLPVDAFCWLDLERR